MVVDLVVLLLYNLLCLVSMQGYGGSLIFTAAIEDRLLKFL